MAANTTLTHRWQLLVVSVQPLIEPLTAFIAKANAFVQSAGQQGQQLREQDFALPEQIKQIVESVYGNLPAALTPVVESMKLYLTNRTSLNKTLILLKVCRLANTSSLRMRKLTAIHNNDDDNDQQDKVLQSFTELHELLERHYLPQDRLLLSVASVDMQRRNLESFFATALASVAVARSSSAGTGSIYIVTAPTTPAINANGSGEQASNAEREAEDMPTSVATEEPATTTTTTTLTRDESHAQQAPASAATESVSA
jgi:hypothetical protein